MRFYLGYINHLGRLPKKSARLVRQAHQPVRQAHQLVRQAGFTITEVLLASSMMLIAISVAGIGVTNLLRSNYRANAGTEIQNNLNLTLEFVSDEVRRAKTIADSEATAAAIESVPEEARTEEARAVLAFQIPNPNDLSQPLPNQIVYYTQNSRTQDSLTGLVLWRYGPNLDEDGNYDINSWIPSPVTDRLAAAANNPNCPTGFTRIPADTVDGFYACIRAGGNQVILNANAEVNLTTGDTDKDKVKYSVSTRVSPRATN